MNKVLNAEQIKSIQFGLFYCSACAKSFERNELKILSLGEDQYLNCPLCGHNIDVEYGDDSD